ncbi:MAG: hydrogenase expression/formation C-terminal domain-containing protein [Caldimonas sp.]
MRPVTIPIRSLAAEPEEAIVYMPMPHEMSTFSMPHVPEPGPGSDVAGACEVLASFLARYTAWLDAGGELPRVDLKDLPAEPLRVVNETLGEGEVAATAEDDHEIRIQETVFTGVWREQHFAADGSLLHDYLLAAPVPPVIGRLARERGGARLRDIALPAGAMNVPALLHELQDAMDRCTPDAPAHVVNLTLLPLSPDDTSHIDRVLDGGSVVILSRGFGNCRISSTAARDVWRVQYFNNMQTLILNTIEVTAMPEAAVAAREDLVETRVRLADLVEWMRDSIAEA